MRKRLKAFALLGNAGTSEIQQLVIARAISGLRIE
jgi:hypothetical protein